MNVGTLKFTLRRQELYELLAASAKRYYEEGAAKEKELPDLEESWKQVQEARGAARQAAQERAAARHANSTSNYTWQDGKNAEEDPVQVLKNEIRGAFRKHKAFKFLSEHLPEQEKFDLTYSELVQFEIIRNVLDRVY